MDLIDLHAHTTASDGSLTPSELVDRAKAIGLKALAITDHDTLAGLPEALSRAREIGLEVVSGVEISAEFKPGTMHVLGYDFDYLHPELTAGLKTLQESRRTRNPNIAAKLAALNKPVTMAEVEAQAGGGQVGRPHFAKVMVAKGYVSGIDEAFNKFLAKDGPAYVDKFRFTPSQAVALIREAGGAPVLAHPFTLNLADGQLAELLDELMAAGLVGLEAYYSKHTAELTRAYVALAGKMGLALTGGSDFHGDGLAGIDLGRGAGNLNLPYSLLVELRRKHKGGI
ncbi:MAG: PHP domain-containing protein [Thermodesulfobacteriota bacterium]